MAGLSDRLDSFPEPWKPEPGDKIVGTVTELDTRDSEYGDPYTIVTVLTDEGDEKAVHCFHTMLRNAIDRKNPEIGDKFGAAYFGKAETAAPGMNPAEKYRVIVEKQNGAAPKAQDEPEAQGAPPPDAAKASDGDDIPF